MKSRTGLWWLICVAGFLWLALDGAMHWDEPAYLYTGGFLSLEEIFRGDFQPSGIHSFYLTRPLHVVLIHAVVSMTGPGMAALGVVIAGCTLSLLTFLFVSRIILSELLAGCKTLSPAIALGLWIPVAPYLAFKTLPESGALLCSAVMLLGVVKASTAKDALRVTGWAAAATAGMMLTLWLKGPMLLLAGSGVLAILIGGGRKTPRLKLIGYTVLATGAGLGLAYLGVMAVGIDTSIYTGGVTRVGGEYEPISARLLNNGVEVGWFILALPLASWSSNRRGFAVMALWFLIATVPLALLFPSMEARYQSPNVPSLIGLTALAMEGLGPRLLGWWRARRAVLVTLAGLALVLVLVSHKLAISVMQHEVKMNQIHAMLGRLDQQYGKDNYALLCSWGYSDFLYLRFVYPDRAIYSTFEPVRLEVEGLSPELMDESRQAYYDDRVLTGPADLAVCADRTPVLFGFHYNFAATNLRTIFDHVPGKPLEAELEKMDLVDHLSTSWLWEHPDYTLTQVQRVGHYHAFEVQSAKPRDDTGAGD